MTTMSVSLSLLSSNQDITAVLPVDSAELDIKPARVQSFAPIHFPWLTELRFLTAFAVLIHHVETTRNVMGLGLYPSGWMQILGPNGVRVFFVLSGFLITHLLLSEVKRTGTVAVKKFYIRRALRIWPLYYALLAVSFLIPTAFFAVKAESQMSLWAAAQMQNFIPKMSLFICMLPNLAILLYEPVAGFAQAWSIGVEEQFYLIWPVLVKRFKNRPLIALLSVLITKIATSTLLSIVLRTRKITMPDEFRSFLGNAFNFVNSLQIEAMVIGGIAAYLLITKPDAVLGLVRNRFFQLAVVAGLFWTMSANFVALQHLIPVDIVFAAMILCLTNSGVEPPSLLRRPLTYLGKISYGIYMLHPLGIYLAYKIVCATGLSTVSLGFTAAVCSASIVLSIALSVLSYEFYEKRFLVLKSQYAVVASSAG